MWSIYDLVDWSIKQEDYGRDVTAHALGSQFLKQCHQMVLVDAKTKTEL